MASASASRRVAHRVLVRVFDEGAYADRAFAVEAAQLDARDRAFAQRIAYGAIQRVRTLDHALERSAAAPWPSSTFRCGPRFGSAPTSSRFLDGVPARASVNEAVELVRGRRRRPGDGSRQRGPPPRGRRVPSAARRRCPRATPAEAALKHSYPDWVAETWWREWGPRRRWR